MPSSGEQTGLKLRVAAATHVGLVRARNEDRFLLADLGAGALAPDGHVEVSGRGFALGVCDGMGGSAAGHIASMIAVDVVVGEMQRGGANSDDTLAAALARGVYAADAEIARHAATHPERLGMGTTCTVATCRRDTLFLAQVGDSRAYLMRAGVLTQLTKDQILANELLALGGMSPGTASRSPAANFILQALGRTDDIQVDLTSVLLRRGDRLLLCSDGLSKLVGDDAIASALSGADEPEALCTRLVDAALAGGGHDNVTVVVCIFEGASLLPPQAGEQPTYSPYVLADHALYQDCVAEVSVYPAAKGQRGKARPVLRSVLAALALAAVTAVLWSWEPWSTPAATAEGARVPRAARPVSVAPRSTEAAPDTPAASAPSAAPPAHAELPIDTPEKAPGRGGRRPKPDTPPVALPRAPVVPPPDPRPSPGPPSWTAPRGAAANPFD